MQRNNLKMCLRSIDSATDTSEVAKVCILTSGIISSYFLYWQFWEKISSKFPFFLSMQAYGGGGSPSSSSFIIRMDEYNQWLLDDASLPHSHWGMKHYYYCSNAHLWLCQLTLTKVQTMLCFDCVDEPFLILSAHRIYFILESDKSFHNLKNSWSSPCG